MSRHLYDPDLPRTPASNWAMAGALVALLSVVIAAATAVRAYVEWRSEGPVSMSTTAHLQVEGV